jgi:hypothetical protein
MACNRADVMAGLLFVIELISGLDIKTLVKFRSKRLSI